VFSVSRKKNKMANAAAKRRNFWLPDLGMEIEL